MGVTATPEQPSFEQARDELTDVVRSLEAGGTTLEESLALICQQWLDAARTRLDAAHAPKPAED